MAYFTDGSGELELVWFQKAAWVAKGLRPGTDYVAFGKPSRFGSKFSIAHPELEVLNAHNNKGGYLQPVYHSTEKLKRKFLDSKAISKIQEHLLELAAQLHSRNLPLNILDQYRLISKKEALQQIHFPQNPEWLQKALFRLKFEELFYIQLRLLKAKAGPHRKV